MRRKNVGIIGKSIAVFLVFLAVLSALLVTSYIQAQNPKDEIKPLPSGRTYTVRYVGIEYGKATEINPLLFYENGSYPTKYMVGSETRVDDLKGVVIKTYVPDFFEGINDPFIEASEETGIYISSGGFYIDENTEYEFEGWYLDKGCTVAYDGILGDDEQGDITLYAKLFRVLWSEFY